MPQFVSEFQDHMQSILFAHSILNTGIDRTKNNIVNCNIWNF